MHVYNIKLALERNLDAEHHNQVLPQPLLSLSLSFLICKVGTIPVLSTLQMVLDGKALQPYKILLNVTYSKCYRGSGLRESGMVQHRLGGLLKILNHTQ